MKKPKKEKFIISEELKGELAMIELVRILRFPEEYDSFMNQLMPDMQAEMALLKSFIGARYEEDFGIPNSPDDIINGGKK